MAEHTASGPLAVLERINNATSGHDLDALAACFTTDYRSEWPVHPSRTFVGVGQVRENWARIFAAVPDVRTEVISAVVDGGRVWGEWEFTGTRTDGAPFLMRGVVILATDHDLVTHGRFYLEPVENDVDAAGAVSRLTGVPESAVSS